MLSTNVRFEHGGASSQAQFEPELTNNTSCVIGGVLFLAWGVSITAELACENHATLSQYNGV